MPARHLDWCNYREEPKAWARELGVPVEAVEIYLSVSVREAASAVPRKAVSSIPVGYWPPTFLPGC